jgi:transposase
MHTAERPPAESSIHRKIDSLAAAISSLIASDPLWARLDPTFRSIKVVADRTVARFMAELPEIGLDFQDRR